MEKETRSSALPKVTARTTRTDLLKAYQDALVKIEQLSSGGQQEAEKEPVERSDEQASAYTVDSIIRNLAELQVGVSKALNELGQKLTAEAGKLSELRTAISFESTRLKQLHDIEYNVNTLTALLDAQAERKAAFEKEMAEKQQAFDMEVSHRREEWKKEQQDHENAIKERDLFVKKQRERDEDEYKYKLSVERRKETADYETRKTELQQQLLEEKKNADQDIVERTKILAAQEAEVADLRKKAERFPAELEEAVRKAEATIRSSMKQQYEMQAKLDAKDTDAEKRVNELKIANLEQIVSKQQVQLTDLSKQLQLATKQVQEMALRAIEGASGFKQSMVAGESSVEGSKAAK
ncbi:MAG: hypothetical protein V1799_13595 [bacterium]